MENYSPPATKERQDLLAGIGCTIFGSCFFASFITNLDARATFYVCFIAFVLSLFCIYLNFKYREEDFTRINLVSIVTFCCSLIGIVLSVTNPSFEFLMYFGLLSAAFNLGLFILASVLSCRGTPLSEKQA